MATERDGRGTRPQPSRWLITTASSAVVLAGGWLALSALLSGSDADPVTRWNGLSVGTVVVTVATIRVLAPTRNGSLSVINVLLGCWVLAAPAVLHLGDDATVATAWTGRAAGVVILLLSMTSAVLTEARNAAAEPA